MLWRFVQKLLLGFNLRQGVYVTLASFSTKPLCNFTKMFKPKFNWLGLENAGVFEST